MEWRIFDWFNCRHRRSGAARPERVELILLFVYACIDQDCNYDEDILCITPLWIENGS